LDLGEALSAEAELRPTEGGGKHPPEAESFGRSSAGDSKRREMPSAPATSCPACLRAMSLVSTILDPP